MIVQIYEIQTPEEAQKCIEAGVDHLGSVLLSRESWRLEEIRDVVDLCRQAGCRSSLIPLFQDRDTLYRVLEYYEPHYLHFCESLTDSQGRMLEIGPLVRTQADIKERFPELSIIRSIPIPRERQAPELPFLDIALLFAPVSDIFLIDTWLGEEPVEGFVGITGKTCDRLRASALVREGAIPVILAGGLGPENVYEAVLDVLPAGADSCTRTNAVDAAGLPIRFKKDFNKVETFVTEVRRAEEDAAGRREEIRAKIEALGDELKEREKALPAHSIRPHQIMAIEELEDEIALLEEEQKRLRALDGPLP
ncbi:MAG: hypothetical protein JW821_07620 [Deltaproteobacteria bacterium]|nr:hypothetical protein [Deltaproteobacteria bacterium]